MAWFDPSETRRREVAKERLILDATELVCEALEEREVSRSELARRLNVHPSEITQRLQGQRNLTLASVAEMFDALQYDVEVCKVDRNRAVHVIDIDGVRKRLVRAPWSVSVTSGTAGSAYKTQPVLQREDPLAV